MENKYVSVFTLNKYIKAKMDQDIVLQSVYIKGEISNYRPHPSGHLYFTLKDEKSRVSAVMFSTPAKDLDFIVENGMQVLIQARVSVYEVTGQYQIYVQSMQEDGVGNLYLRFEKLKKQLEKEGLFDQSHKKKIPLFPKSIAVLSAKQGAAIQDIIRTLYLRFPFSKVIVFPIPVQGKNAYIQIIDTLKAVDKLGFDTIILGRGGGSIEDLWNFNEEALVRCIYGINTPLITGIGHETDFTICDFVGDYRAVTPTAAATKATPDQNELRKQCFDLSNQLNYKMQHRIEIQSHLLNSMKKSYYLTNPEYLYSNELMRLNKLQDQFSYKFKVFDIQLKQELLDFKKFLKQNIDHNLNCYMNKHIELFTKLDALSPLKVMQRGYALVTRDENVIKYASELISGDEIQIQFSDDIKKAKIK